MRQWLVLIGGVLFGLGLGAHIYVKIYLQPPKDLDEVYYEFQDQDPDYQRYLRWYRWTLGLSSLGVLFLFVALVL